MARTWSAAVIGLSTTILTGTEWPLSASRGISSFTRPARTGAPPASFATSGANGSAAAARDSRPASSAQAVPARTVRKRRRGLCSISAFHQRASSAQGEQVSDGVLDLLRGQYRLAAPGLRHLAEPLDTVVGRHDAPGVQPHGIDDAQADLPFGEPRADAGERRPDIAHEAHGGLGHG